MKITTKLAIAIGCATLAACGGGQEANNTDMNADANLMMSDNLGMPTDNNMVVSADNVTVVENGTNTTDLNTTDLNATNNTL